MSDSTFSLEELNRIVDAVDSTPPGEMVLMSDGVVRWVERKADGGIVVVMTEEAYQKIPTVKEKPL